MFSRRRWAYMTRAVFAPVPEARRIISAMRLAQLIAIVLAAVLAAPQARAQGISFEDVELQADLSRLVGQLAQTACSSDIKAAQSAAGALAEIQQAYYQPLLEAMDAHDPEVHARATEILNQAVFQAVVCRTMVGLSPEMRRKLELFADDHRELVESCLLGEDSQRVAAIAQLRKMRGRPQSVEPLLRALLSSPSLEVVAAAASAVVELECKSDEMAQALCVALARFITARAEPTGPQMRMRMSARMMIYGQMGDLSGILEALVMTRGKKAAPVLAAVLLRKDETSRYPSASLIEALAATGEKGLIPTLVDRLSIVRSESISSFQLGSTLATSRKSDGVILALLALAHLNSAEYEVLDFSGVYNSPYMPSAGFASDKTRRAAQDKLRAWWEKAARTPEYKDIKPVAIADLAQWAKGRTSAAAQAADAQSQPASQSTGIALPPTQDVRDRLSQLLKRHAANLGSPRQSQRRNAQAAINSVMGGMLSAMLGVEGLTDGDALDDALNGALVEARFSVFLADLPAPDRAKLALYRKSHAQIVQAVFSGNSIAAAQAVRTLDKNDPDTLAEPLLLHCMHSTSPEIVMAAVDAIASGHYKSQPVIARLLDLLAHSNPLMALQNYGGGNDPASSVFKAVKALKPPGAMPILLAHLINRPYGSDWQTEAVVVDAMEAIGDVRALPVLVERIRNGRRSNRSTMNINGKAFTWSDSDGALYLAIKLTDQNPDDYGISRQTINNSPGVKAIGFANDKARTDAVKKFIAWWDANKDTDAYKNLKPLTVPVINPNNEGGVTDFEMDGAMFR